MSDEGKEGTESMLSQNGPSEGKVTAPVSAAIAPDPPDPEVPEERELARLRRENEWLGQRLVAAEAVIEIHKEVFASGRPRRAEPAERRALLMASVADLVPVVGVTTACEMLGVARASFYRHARKQITAVTPVAVDHSQPNSRRIIS
jgi:hypothetical protein